MHFIIIFAAITAFAQGASAGPTGNCNSDKFTCLDGTCIDKQYLCDAKKNCPDSSDEVFSTCYNTTCNGFRCNYGGCIDANLTCNNINDCWDMSDENKYLCANDTTILELLTELRGSCTNEYAMECHMPKSNKCLSWNQVCDGVGDCKEGEDEDKNICGNTQCPSGSFQCENGSCINKDRQCDHNVDCADGSDEMPAICKKMQIDNPPSSLVNEWSTRTCTLVPKQHMHVSDYFSQFKYKPEGQVPDQSIVELTCDDGYETFGYNINSCQNSIWKNSGTLCIPCCEPSPYSRNIIYSTKCSDKSDIVDCNDRSRVQNTELLVSCSAGYMSDSSRDQVGRHVCNENGEWIVDKANPICKPICGVNSPQHPDITPWAVSLFRRTTADAIYTFKCMGTILSPYIVITAEACFTGKEEPKSPLFFKIVEGNHKIKFREDDDHGYTLHNIMEIHIIIHQYNQRAALLHVVKPFIFGGLVRPICLSPSYDETKPLEMEGVFDKDQLGEGKTEYDESMYYLTYFVASESVAYNVRSFISDIKGYISKSEQDP